MSELIDRDDPKVFEALWNERMAEAAKADSQAAFARAFNGAMQDPEVVEDRNLEMAVAAYEALDEMLAPGGIAEKLPRSERLRMETEVYRAHGPRPEFLTPAEIVENERAAAVAESARMRMELEQWNLQMADELGFANADEAREWYRMPASQRPPAPVPSLIQTEQGVPAYVMPDGSLVEEYAVAFGKAARNPKFAEIAARVEKLQKARR